MSTPIFKTRHDERGVLWVQMDTPGSEVNIFSANAAEELIAVMDAVDPSATSAVVFTSAKSRSFINGAQLMLASAVQSPGAIFEMTSLLRRAYAGVARCPVPTIAAVAGSCYGCGVEFTLNCDLRVATKSPDATFYMTEIADYLNTPAFGSTQRLPAMMGLRRGLGFLLWGHRLWGQRALDHRLIDALLPAHDFDAALERVLDRVLSDQLQPHAPLSETADAIDATAAGTRALIDQLPQNYQRIYTRCLDLMVYAARRGAISPTEDDFRKELAAAGETLVESQAQSARSFLYLRQVAERVHVRRLPKRAPLCVMLNPNVDAGADALFHELEQRPLREITCRVAPKNRGEALTLQLQPDGPGGSDGDAAETIALHVHAGAPTQKIPNDDALHLRRAFPTLTLSDGECALPGTGTRPLLEVRLPKDRVEALGHVFEWLDACGFSVVFSRAKDTFLSDRFLMALLGPCVAAFEHGLTVGDVEATLREDGLVPSPLSRARRSFKPADIVASLQPFLPKISEDAVAEALEYLLGYPRADEGRASESLSAAIHLNLLATIVRAREAGELAHPTVADVIARELLGYPVGRTSLCEHLTPGRVAQMLKQVDEHWIPASNLELARDFVARERSFYV